MMTRSQTSSQDSDTITACFTTMSSQAEITHHEYLKFVHETERTVLKIETKKSLISPWLISSGTQISVTYITPQ